MLADYVRSGRHRAELLQEPSARRCTGLDGSSGRRGISRSRWCFGEGTIGARGRASDASVFAALRQMPHLARFLTKPAKRAKLVKHAKHAKADYPAFRG